jgi:hypothetical protein
MQRDVHNRRNAITHSGGPSPGLPPVCNFYSAVVKYRLSSQSATRDPLCLAFERMPHPSYFGVGSGAPEGAAQPSPARKRWERIANRIGAPCRGGIRVRALHGARAIEVRLFPSPPKFPRTHNPNPHDERIPYITTRPCRRTTQLGQATQHSASRHREKKIQGGTTQ